MRRSLLTLSSRSMEGVLSLKEFLVKNSSAVQISVDKVAGEWQKAVENREQEGLKFHIETYGCQMNVADSDVVRAVLLQSGHSSVDNIEEADVILTK
jgi:hypothetical protein